tara:strand:- start:1680 stop:1958 length:279 start_codon:yes stop_codon:yes gene_type:complete
MTVQEIMERVGSKEPTLVIAWIKDAIHLIESNTKENLKVQKSNIIDGIREYPLPVDMVSIKTISVKDTSDNKYKTIKRIVNEPTVSEDTDPE